MATTKRDDPPTSPAERVATKNTVRGQRPALIIGVVAIVALLLPVVVLPSTSQARADRVAERYEPAVVALRYDLPDTQVALQVVTSPASTPADYGVVLPTLNDLQNDAQEAADIAGGRMPFAWPLASSQPFDELRPVRDTLSAAAKTADETAATLVNLLNYRAIYVQMFDFGELPARAPQPFNRFKGTLADLSATQVALLDELPSFDGVGAHRSDVAAAVRRFERWIEEYADALWIGDEATVNGLLAEQRSTRLRLDRSLIDALSAIRTTVDIRLVELAADLDDAIATLAQ